MRKEEKRSLCICPCISLMAIKYLYAEYEYVTFKRGIVLMITVTVDISTMIYFDVGIVSSHAMQLIDSLYVSLRNLVKMFTKSAFVHKFAALSKKSTPFRTLYWSSVFLFRASRVTRLLLCTMIVGIIVDFRQSIRSKNLPNCHSIVENYYENNLMKWLENFRHSTNYL